MKNINKSVLVTGGAGFIGHHLIKHILEHTDYNVISIDRIDISSSLGRLQTVLKSNPAWKKRIKVVWHDLKSPLNNYVVDEIGEVNYILHLAAGSHVDRSVKNPLQFIMDNVIGTANLLEYARKHANNLEIFLNFSTDEVFGPSSPGVLFKEHDRHNPCNPYSASKSAAEQICNAYYMTYEIPIITTHTMNVYGIRQSEEKFIPLVINKLKNNEKVSIHTDKDGNIGSRKYLHTTDVSEAILLLLNYGVVGEKYNISSDVEIDNLSLAKEIARIVKKELVYELQYPFETRGVNDIRYSISGEKIRKLGWIPKVSLRKGLEDVAKWHIDKE
jgi:dTDP-glucose 4,6-dehydratase